MADLNLEIERAEFEAEVRKVNSTSEITDRWPGGAYKHHGMEGRWHGWLMARSAAPSPVADDGLPEPVAAFAPNGRAVKWDVNYAKEPWASAGYMRLYTADQVRQVQLEAYEAGRVAAVPDSWKLVPIEPTGEQLRAELTFDASGCQMGEIYRSMLDAAHQPPKEKP